MHSRYISLACYSAIVTSFIMKLMNKFKMSFKGTRETFADCPPPYIAAHFAKNWQSTDGKACFSVRSLIFGPDFKKPESRRELFEFCSTFLCTDGFSFNHISTISNDLPEGFAVGDTSNIAGILSETDIYNIIGKYYELLAKENR